MYNFGKTIEKARLKGIGVVSTTTVLSNLSTFLGVSIIGGGSLFSVMHLSSNKAEKNVVESASVDGASSLRGTREIPAGQSPMSGDPQACARLAQIVADATDQGFLLKAEQSEQRMKTLNCVTTAGR